MAWGERRIVREEGAVEEEREGEEDPWGCPLEVEEDETGNGVPGASEEESPSLELHSFSESEDQSRRFIPVPLMSFWRLCRDCLTREELREGGVMPRITEASESVVARFLVSNTFCSKMLRSVARYSFFRRSRLRISSSRPRARSRLFLRWPSLEMLCFSARRDTFLSIFFS